MNELISKKLAAQVIINRRAKVARLLIEVSPNIRSGTIELISAADLELLFDLYDRIFFEGTFASRFKGKFKFSLSSRMTRSAGKTICPKNIERCKPEDLTIEIRIGVELLFQYDSIEGNKKVGGISTANSLEALQLVFEHELCHAIELLCFHKTSCRGVRFKTIANNLFGHTESYHELPTFRQIAAQRLGAKPGDTVVFTFEGKKLSGILYNINKRAVVMVKDKQGRYADNKGNRYSKYYVPLELLNNNDRLNE